MQWLFALCPPILTAHRYHIYLTNERGFSAIVDGGSEAKKAFNKIILDSYEAITDPDLRRRLTPTYESGCKRITPSPRYATVYSNSKFASKPDVNYI